MRKVTVFLFALILPLAFETTAFAATTPSTSTITSTTNSNFRAVWVCSVANLDYPSRKGLTVDQLKAEADSIISKTLQMGLNAIILQVRPHSDALYKSEIFPWSSVLTGVQGQPPAGGFDPLAYWIEQSHKRGIQLHAWLNPYRVTHSGEKITNTDKLAPSNPARLDSHRVVAHNGELYYDPGTPENRWLILYGIMEILLNYDVDGIHLDDYFYPGTSFADDSTYNMYGAGLSKDNWRRENVNTLVKQAQKIVHQIKPNARFGISPFAIWLNKSSDPLGSDTKGGEAYKEMYADTRRWVKEGWVDYICPQIYWTIGYKIADYRKLLNWWGDVCNGTGVDLYIGHASYREAEGQSGWKGEILRQLALNETSGFVKGSVFFRSGSLNGSVGRQLANKYVPAAPSS